MFRTYNESNPVPVSYDKSSVAFGDEIPPSFLYRCSFIADTYRNCHLLPNEDELSDVFQAFGI